MTRKTRRRFSPQEKLKILRLHLLEDRPISELCEQHGIHPTLFYPWQKVCFDNGAAAFAARSQRPSADQQIIGRLQDKLRHKDEVVRTSMEEADAEIVLQRGREAWPEARPRIISDRGRQFVARDFQEFIRRWQTSPVLTSPHYPQSNGKLERFHRTLKAQAIRPKTPLCHEDARRVVGEFIEHYNTVRLHSAIGYLTPQDKLEGRAEAILRARDEKLEAARARRAARREELRAS